MTKDDYFLLDNIIASLTQITMEKENLDLVQALDKIYGSKTFEKLQNPSTGLLSQSPLYIYDVLRTNG
ncbi:MAG: hypothetical protein NC102_02205 [Clostridium sp.]|nr:hypothetical protein [Clostridium sp.]